jgi:hypothetical protein
MGTPLTVSFRGDRIARRGRTARPLWQTRSPSGCVTAGTHWRRVRGNGAAAAARAVRPQRKGSGPGPPPTNGETPPQPQPPTAGTLARPTVSLG